VVAQIAREVGISQAQARRRAADVLRLAAVADGDALPPRRVERLERAARARLWLSEIFEPAHGPDAIADDDPLVAEVLRGFSVVREHPVAVFCQILVAPDPMPDGGTEPSEAFWARAQPVYDTVTGFLAPLVPVGRDGACPTLRDLVRFVPRAYAPGVEVRYEAGGVDLGRCLERAGDGTCAKPFLDPAWERAITAAQAPAAVGPIRSRFGLHWVILHEKLPPAPRSDPKVEAALRKAVLVEYRARELARTLARMRAERGVRTAPLSGTDAGG